MTVSKNAHQIIRELFATPDLFSNQVKDQIVEALEKYGNECFDEALMMAANVGILYPHTGLCHCDLCDNGAHGGYDDLRIKEECGSEIATQIRAIKRRRRDE